MGKSPFLMGKSPFLIWIDGDLPSGYVKIAMENGHRNSGFSH